MGHITQALLVVGNEECGRLEALRRYASDNAIALTEVAESRFVQSPAEFMGEQQYLLAVLTDEQLPGYLDLAERLGCVLGVVPREKQTRLHEWFNLPRNVDEAIALACSDQPQKIDVLRCNGEITLGLVMMGETPFLDGRSKRFQNRGHSLIEQWLYRLALILLWLNDSGHPDRALSFAQP